MSETMEGHETVSTKPVAFEACEKATDVVNDCQASNGNTENTW